MMPCVYCIGCIHYRMDETPWCERPDRERCVNREYYCGRYGGERFPFKPEAYEEMDHDS